MMLAALNGTFTAGNFPDHLKNDVFDLFQQGRHSENLIFNKFLATLDNGRVTVPARCWKVVVILPIGTDDATRVTTSTRVIAIDTPNDNGISTT